MNIKSEQLCKDMNIVIDQDQPLKGSKIFNPIITALGIESCVVLDKRKHILLYKKNKNEQEIFLLSSVTYMGGNGQHPIFKKRSQLKPWYKEYVKENECINTNVRFIGIYHYHGNIIFFEYEKSSFMKKKMNNSAVHIYMNDMYQAMKEGTFTRIDANDNMIHSIAPGQFKKYIHEGLKDNSVIFTQLKKFNESFSFGSWINAEDAIVEMHTNQWKNWKQAEWPGFYLEYKFDRFSSDPAIKGIMQYVGDKNKSKGQYDFDIWFSEENFYGDLKSSNITVFESPGNDQVNFINCINEYGKFWYIIYEHQTVKDNEESDFVATKFRNHYMHDLGEWPKNKEFNELSYCKRMKKSVRFVKMTVIELNKVNFREVLNDFKQGRQQNGTQRNVKFKINKRNVDNFVIFKQNYLDVL